MDDRRVVNTVKKDIVLDDDILEIDLNPVIVYEHGLSIADARILLKKDIRITIW
ncbi:MAG: acetate--CoA ligase family protein [Proteobacteria bacterium]|nr:acetate--CoA ligase family protein [Pseudomonadota bacterium]MBU1902950.1 acetate--CoA ligase family protein [Pseudomonadota bacterium]